MCVLFMTFKTSRSRTYAVRDLPSTTGLNDYHSADTVMLVICLDPVLVLL